jgi:hypothetical protein
MRGENGEKGYKKIYENMRKICENAKNLVDTRCKELPVHTHTK